MLEKTGPKKAFSFSRCVRFLSWRRSKLRPNRKSNIAYRYNETKGTCSKEESHSHSTSEAFISTDTERRLEVSKMVNEQVYKTGNDNCDSLFNQAKSNAETRIHNANIVLKEISIQN